MRHRRLTVIICLFAFVLCLFRPTAAEGAEPFDIPEEVAEEILEAEQEDETEDPGLWQARITLAKSPTIALRKTMTTGNSFTATGSALKGEIVTVLEENQQWAYVRARDGEGYIMLKFLTRVEPGTEDPTLQPDVTEPEPDNPGAPGLPDPNEPYTPSAYLNTRAAFPQEENEAQKVLLTFIGDVTLGCNEADHKSPRSITTYINYCGYDYPFKKVHYLLEQDDLTIANLEGTFHSDSSGLTPQTKKAYNFRATPDYAAVLTQASIEAVALGNNHSIDYGEPGFTETVAVLEENGIDWFGNTDHGAKGFVYHHNGVKIGFVSCYVSYWVINNGEHIPEINATIDEVRAQDVDVLIAYMHGGVEYDAKHDKNQERFAQYFINKGADIVIGSHPHRLQGCQLIDDVPVFYSLGNFVFGGNARFYNKRHNTTIRYTAVLQCALSFDDSGKYLGCRFNIIPCRLGEDEMINQYQPFPVTGEEAEACIKELQVDTNKFWRLEDLLPDIGAMQVFIPARR